MNILRTLVASTLMTLTFFAHAESNVYAGVQYVLGAFISDTREGEVDILMAKAGFRYNGWQAELRHANTVNMIDTYNAGRKEVVGPERISGLLGLYEWRNSSSLVPFVAAGYSTVDAKIIKEGSVKVAREQGVSYGFGMRVKMIRGIQGYFEYMSYVDNGEVNVGGVGVGVGYEF